MEFLMKYKFIVLGIGIILVGGIVGILVFNKGNTTVETSVTAGEQKTLATEAKVIEVEEKVIKVAADTSVDKVEEKEETVVKYKDKEITIPKRTVAAAKDSEDGQKQKTAGENATVASFENDGQYVGIDVSSWQGNINWPQVAASGVQFAMIRVGFRGYAEEGNIKEDAYFRQNVKGAVSNGIKVGIYFYSTARTEDEALQEAAWVVDKIKAYSITYPVAYDFEEFGMHRTANISGQQATNNAIAFLNYIGSQGFGTMMYANKSDITNRFQKSRLPYKFWLAHYTSSTDYTGSYQMWQRTSKGSVPGISGYVDMNIAYFGYGSVAKPKHTHDFENGTVIGKIVEPTCTKPGYKVMRCKECSESQKIDIPATGKHEYEWVVDEKNSTEGKYILIGTCKICKETTKKTSTERPVTNTTNSITNTNTTNTVDNNTTNSVVNETDTSNTVNNEIADGNTSDSENKTNTVVDENTSATDTTVENKVANETSNTEGTLDPHTHVWDEGTVVTEATCTEEGERAYKCSCGETKTEKIPALGHNYSNGSCTRCGNEDPDFEAQTNEEE